MEKSGLTYSIVTEVALRLLQKNQENPRLATVDGKFLPLGTPEKKEAYFRAIQQVEEAQIVLEREFMGLPYVIREIRGTEPIQFFPLGDLHIGHKATDMFALRTIVKRICETPNAFAGIFGDGIEGFKSEYADTNVSGQAYDLQRQISVYREEVLIPLLRANKLLAYVTGYNGHDGWIEKQTTLDIHPQIVNGLNLPLVMNSGDLILQFPDLEKSIRIRKYHVPPSGTTTKKSLGGLLQEANSYPKDNPDRPDIYINAHIHTNTIGSDGTAHFAAVGTFKGVQGYVLEPNEYPDVERTRMLQVPDMHYIKNIVGKSPQPAGVTITLVPTKEKIITVLASRYRDADTLLNAAEVWNLLEQKGATQEILGAIQSNNPDPKIRFQPKESVSKIDIPHTTKPEIEEDEDKEEPVPPDRLWTSSRITAKTSLPIMVMTLANTRFGSSSAESDRNKKALQESLNVILSNPNIVALVLRNMIEADTAKLPHRREIIEKLISTLLPIGEQKKILGYLMSSGNQYDGGMRSRAWKRKVGHDDAWNPKPGTVIAEQLHTRLLDNNSTVELEFKGNNGSSPRYQILVADKLEGGGSKDDPTMGLRNLRKLRDRSYDAVVGGHLAQSATQTNYNPKLANNTRLQTYLHPGHFADVDAGGLGNYIEGSLGGQALIFMPKEKLVVPVVNPSETAEVFLMLTLLSGILQNRDLRKQVLAMTEKQ